MTNLDSIFKSRDITLPTKVCLVKAMVFSSSHVWMWELNCEESWALKNLCFWTVVLEKTLESPLDYKEIQPVHSKGDQSWVFIGRTDAKAETPILWPPDEKSWLIGEDSDAGRDWGQEKKRTREDEMAGCHHWLYGRESEWSPGVGDGQGGLACCDSWGRKESDTTERMNWTETQSWDTMYHSMRKEVRRVCSLNWLPYLLFTWLDDFVFSDYFPARSGKQPVSFRKLKNLTKAVVMKSKTNQWLFSGKYEAVIMQLPQVENIAFTKRAQFAGSKRHVS